MKRIFFVSVVAGSMLFGFAFFVSASSPFDITFPIPELGDCADQNSCKAYCDDFSHKDVCIAFAQKHGLASDKQVEQVKNLPPVGPGGCKSESECRAYCDDSSNVEECLTFAEEHGLISKEKVERTREFIKGGPGGCKGPKECRTYCEDASNQEECFAFAEKHNLVPKEELERARTLSKEGGPGGCKGESECRAYCQASTHAEECVDFAVKLGMLSKEQAARIKKAAVLGGPGGCKGEECREYCEDPANQVECIAFAEENGFMSPEDAARARKFAGKTGPGGCIGEQCRDFCEKPENAPVCLEFAEREGLIPPEEVARARKFLVVSEQGGPGGCRGIECRDYCQDLAHQDECFAFAKGNGLLRAQDEQNFEAGRKLQKVVQESGGPGGCKNDQECRAFCTDASHVEECIAFASTQGGIPDDEARQMLRQFTEQKFHESGEFHQRGEFERFEQNSQKRFEEFRQLEHQFRGPEGPGFKGPQFGPATSAGPGGCASPTECIKYCTEHKDECFSFGPAGKPGAVPPEGGIPPGKEFAPQQIPVRLERARPCPLLPEIECPAGTFKKTFTNSDGCVLSQCIKEGEQRQFQDPPASFDTRSGEQREKAAACTGEGGVWDGSACRAPAASGEFFPETGPLQQQIFQQTQEQTQRQIQQQQLEQQIQQQFQQLQQLQLQQQQTSPQFTPPPASFTPPPPPAGGSVLDAAGSLLRRLFER